jgi:Cd2+/Zn2+-exporting ATPase
MDCAEEVSLLRARLSRLAGVRELAFDVVQGRMEVEYAPGQTSREEIERAVSSAGMRCETWGEGNSRARRTEVWKLALTWASGLALAAGLALQAWTSGEVAATLLSHGHGGEEGHRHEVDPWALGFLGVAVSAGALPVLPKAWASLRSRRADMNLLVTISLSGAAWLGEWAEAATLSFLYSLAGRLEQWSLSRAREAIGELVAGAPVKVSELHGGTRHGDEDDGEHEHLVDAAAVAPGTVVRVRPGEKIAFDGVVVKGRSEVNQAFITGESVAVPKSAGDVVYAGTLNVAGAIDIRATRAASDTMVARMVRMAGESSTRRAPSERFVEQFTRIYTPAILALAGMIAVAPPLFQQGDWHHWLYQGMVVLLIACPCALVISTPVCVVSAITSAARRQVLIKGGAVLEESARIRAIGLDKTAALLSGEPRVERVIALGGRGETEVLEALAALERSSEHPIAKAIVAEAESRGIFAAAAGGFRTLSGLGVESGGDGERRFWAGNPRLANLREEDAAFVQAEAQRAGARGQTVVACGASHGGEAEIWALVTLKQELKPQAAKEIEALMSRGVEHVALLSGDIRESAAAAAAAAGIADVHAELRAADKTARIASMMGRYRHVAFAGDSVHDAEAMAADPVGIALGPGSSDIAKESAGVIILPADLGRVAFLIDHARRTLGVIRQNVWIAVGAKALFLAAAMTGSATLWMAVAADMGATLAVTFNGLRLLRSRWHPMD